MDNLVGYNDLCLGQEGIIDLSNRNLSAKTDVELIKIFSEIPENIHTLNLGWNHFANLNSERLTHIFSLIPLTISDIILSGNALQLKGAELESAFKVLSANLRGISLSWNSLELISTPQLVSAFNGMKAKIERLSLKGNGLGKKSLNELKLILLPLMPSLKYLDLSANFFNMRTGDELISLFSQFSPGLETLILSDNVLAQPHSNALSQLVGALSLNLKLLDLTRNALDELPITYLAAVFHQIPATCTVLVGQGTLNETINMIRLLHYVKTDIDNHTAFPIPLNTSLFIQQLNSDEHIKLFHRLECDAYAQSKENSSWANLACIYLLTNNTDCFSFGLYPLDSHDALLQFAKDEARSHLMLDLINNMAKNSSSLRELGEHICLLLRNITPYKSIKERLNSLYLKPCIYYCPGYTSFDPDEYLPTTMLPLQLVRPKNNFTFFLESTATNLSDEETEKVNLKHPIHR